MMMDKDFKNPLTNSIVAFVRNVGLPVVRGELDDGAFMPGLALDGGRIVIDEARLLYPGDILHEAGHLAVLPPDRREHTQGRLGSDGGEEMGAIAWSYAAALHIGLDPAVLFHADGYKGGANALLENFAEERYVGMPYLQWLGLTIDPARAAQLGVPPFPHMLRWLCEPAMASNLAD